MKAITVTELIQALKELKKPNALVGIATDSEGNGFSLICNEQFLAEGFMSPELGYNEFYDTQEEGTEPTVLLFGTN